tara:strand:+ start:47 stop:586 length:540 start_codon:yes stop_codon:yes gene_type:complete
MGVKSNLQEKVAFLKLKSGNTEAYGYFYDKYVKKVYSFILFKVSDKEIAQDLTQDVFLRTWQHIVDKKELKSFQAFIFSVSRNIVIDHYRQSKKQTIDIDNIPEIEDKNVNINESLDKSIDLSKLLNNIYTLKSEYQEVLLLYYVQDLSISDIAEILQKKKNNVRVIIHRAINKLKEKM